MTVPFPNGRYTARLATGRADLAACQALRHQCFFGRPGRDADPFDALCDHLMVTGDAGLVGTCRMLRVTRLSNTYAAQSYDLTRLSGFGLPMLELGRFCIAPGAAEPDVLRLAWGALAQIVEADGIGLIFGCSSFPGTDPAPYHDALGLLASRHAAPAALAPGRLAAETLTLPAAPRNRRSGVAQLPPLLRSYLAMGGWVSDHAVVDRAMHTLHVFTALEIARIPAARVASLRAVAALTPAIFAPGPHRGLAPATPAE